MRKSFIILALAGLFGCGTQPQLSELVNDMVVVTNFNSEIDFSQYTTYSLTMDTVGLVSNTTNEDALVTDYAKLITTQLKRNLDQSGHTQVASDEDPDLGVNVVVVTDLSISQSYYPGGYYPGYYGYYGGFYGGGYVRTDYFEQAILIVELIDISKSTSTNAVVVWSANIGDLVNSYDRSTKTKEAIDQAFVQSPFLDR